MAKKIEYTRTTYRPVHHFRVKKKSNSGWWIFLFILILLAIGAANSP